MKVLIFAALLVIASAVKVHVDDDVVCSIQGPSYWCKNEKIAKQCHATSYCKEHVWKRSVQQVPDDVCSECEEYVTYVHSMLADNGTKTQVLNAMHMACSVMPSAIQVECDNLLQQYGSQVYDMMVQYMANPKSLCTQIGFCTGSKAAFKNIALLRKVLKQLHKMKVQADTCTTCEQYVGTIHLLISNNETKTEIINGMVQLCTMIGGSQAECTIIIDTIGVKALDALVNYLADPSKLCTTLGFCKSQKHVLQMRKQSSKTIVQLSRAKFNPAKKLVFHATPKQQLGNGELCSICTFGVSYVDGLLKENSTQQEIKTAVLALCQDIPDSLKTECVSYVNQYWDAAIAIIINAMSDSSAVCKQFHMCPASIRAFTPVKKSVPKNAVTCEVCEYAMKTLKAKLLDHATEEEIKQELDKICNYLPSSMSTECASLINQYSDTIITMIVQNLDPDTICKKLNLCAQASEKVVATRKIVKANPVTCQVCQYAMGYLDSLLEQNSTEAEVQAALDKVCGLLPSSVSSECTSLVNQYSNQIIKLIVQELANPTELCTKLGLCSSSLKATPKKIVKANPVTCEVCQYAMKYLDSVLEQNSTEAEVQAALDKMCGYLPPSLKKECTSLVNQYSDKIIKLIVQELANPSVVCKELGLCSSSFKFSRKVPVGDGIGCTVCQDVMEVLDNMLKEDRTKATIKSALDKVCDLFQSNLSGECLQLVGEYSDTLVDLLASELDPNVICKQLKLCTSTKRIHSPKKVVSSPKDSTTCEFCKYAIQYLDDQLKDNRTEEAVKEALDKLCGNLPSVFEKQCKSLFEQYSDIIVQLLIKELDPTTICTELKLCTATKKIVAVEKKKPLKSSVTCELCNFAMGELISTLKDNNTQAEIKQAVENLCAKLPTHLNDECKLLVDEYGEVIIKAITEEVDPSAVCEFIGLCKEKYRTNNRKYMLAMRLSLEGVSCEVCQVAMGYLDSILLSNSTETEIEGLVMKLCSHLPNAIENECDALITEYGPELIKLVIDQIQPDKVCKALKLC